MSKEYFEICAYPKVWTHPVKKNLRICRIRSHWFIVDWIVICQLIKFFGFGLHWVVLATDTLFPYYRSGFTHNWSYLEHYMPLNGHTPNLNKNFLPFSKKRHENYVLLSISDHPVSRVYSLVICDWVLPCWPILDLNPLIFDFFFATWRQSCCSRDGNKWSFTNNT